MIASKISFPVQVFGSAREAVVLRCQEEGLQLPRGDIHDRA
jgi:hypothetical protein